MVMPEGIFPAKGNWHRGDISPNPGNHKLVETEDKLSTSRWGAGALLAQLDPPWTASLTCTCGLVCRNVHFFPLRALFFISLQEVEQVISLENTTVRRASPVCRRGYFNVVIRVQWILALYSEMTPRRCHHTALVDFQSIISTLRLAVWYWMDCTLGHLNYEAVNLGLEILRQSTVIRWIEVKFVSAWQILVK